MIGGTQDNGTRLRLGNGTLHNQVIGGDGMGTALQPGEHQHGDWEFAGLWHADQPQ